MLGLSGLWAADSARSPLRFSYNVRSNTDARYKKESNKTNSDLILICV